MIRFRTIPTANTKPQTGADLHKDSETCAGANPDAPPIMEVRLSFYLEFRPIFHNPGPQPTTVTTTAKPYDRRRRGQFPPGPVPHEVQEWCATFVRQCCIAVRVLINTLWTCTRCCPLVPRCGPQCPCQCPPGLRHVSNSSLAAEWVHGTLYTCPDSIFPPIVLFYYSTILL